MEKDVEAECLRILCRRDSAGHSHILIILSLRRFKKMTEFTPATLKLFEKVGNKAHLLLNLWQGQFSQYHF